MSNVLSPYTVVYTFGIRYLSCWVQSLNHLLVRKPIGCEDAGRRAPQASADKRFPIRWNTLIRWESRISTVKSRALTAESSRKPIGCKDAGRRAPQALTSNRFSMRWNGEIRRFQETNWMRRRWEKSSASLSRQKVFHKKEHTHTWGIKDLNG